ncbi:MAG TPA: PspC domain-containing protein [Thermomicrobiaceae bacterium]|nr:PspC domain-containing protein [Thermomicrobiaceae bacterium]
MATQQINPGGSRDLPDSSATGQHAAPMLRRSRSDRVVAGVCGGVGRYLGVDPVLIRIAWVALAIAAGTGVLLYVLAWIVIPEEHEGEEIAAAPHSDRATVRMVAGGVLIVIGGLLLVNRVAPWVNGQLVWAIALIAVGLLVVSRGVSR